MTPGKAIEILASYKAGSYEDTGPDLDDALTLGVEALKDHLKARAAGWFPPGYKLPGETEE